MYISLFGLAQEYWRPNILFAIVSSVGTPIFTNVIASKPMFDHAFDHFVRVLVDMDKSAQPTSNVLVER